MAAAECVLRSHGLKARLLLIAVLAGLVSLTDTESSSGFPLLSKIPLIGRLFRENLRVKELSQVMLVIKPHLTSLPPSEYLTRQVWLGSETRPLSMY